MTQTEKNDPADSNETTDWKARDSRDHHAGLWSTLVQRADALTAAVSDGESDVRARRALLDLLRGDVLAHLESEQRVLAGAAREVGAEALAATLDADHRFLLSLVDQVEAADSSLEAALSTRALVVLFALRVEKEETVVLPALTAAGVDVAALLESMIVTMATEYDARFTYL